MGKVKRVRLKHNEQIIHMIDSPQGFYAIISPFANIRLSFWLKIITGFFIGEPKVCSRLRFIYRLLMNLYLRVHHMKTH
jgi:hypothetical protein